MTSASASLSMTLDAVIVAVTDDVPRVLAVDAGGVGASGPTQGRLAIPSGPLDHAQDLTLELGLRRWIREQAGIEVGYVEQLYTFGDHGRRPDASSMRQISVAYLALVEETPPMPGSQWVDVYELLPWEDHRGGTPASIDEQIQPALQAWSGADTDRRTRVRLNLGDSWDGTRVLDRYELLYNVGLVAEAARDRGCDVPTDALGLDMLHDHRRIVSTALGRLRGKLTYRPVVFELMPERFTLLELQRTVEALAGVRVHKQNFRRQVEHLGLVEGTGTRQGSHVGRPAELFRYRPEVVLEHSRPGLGQPYS